MVNNRDTLDGFLAGMLADQAALARPYRHMRNPFVRAAMLDNTATMQEMPVVPMCELMADLDRPCDIIARNLDRALAAQAGVVAPAMNVLAVTEILRMEGR